MCFNDSNLYDFLRNGVWINTCSKIISLTLKCIKNLTANQKTLKFVDFAPHFPMDTITVIQMKESELVNTNSYRRPHFRHIVILLFLNFPLELNL